MSLAHDGPARPAPAARVTVIVVSLNSGHCIAPLAEGLKALPQARWRPLARNSGFGAAKNRGLAEAMTEFVLLLNPDCIVAPGAIDALVACADRFPDAAAIAPQLLDRQGRPDLS